VNFDFSGFAGIQVTLADTPGFECRKCGGKTIDGGLIKLFLALVGLEIVRQPERLNAEKARYLRKQLGLTQQQLADRMGIDRVTVTNWETGKEISPQHDFILRAFADNDLNGGLRRILKPAWVAKSMTTSSAALTSVRKEPPTSRSELHPLVVESVLNKLRSPGKSRVGF
jgi:transcriptional regulator with XRE-family HTH domain